jgi:hypothetical protein
MGGNVITISFENVVTISICALLGYGLLVGANMLYAQLTASNQGALAS